MKHNRQLSSLVMLVASAFATGSAHAAPGHPYSDEWIEGRVSGAFSYNSTLDSSEIIVDSSGGSVTIQGSVPTIVEKDYAGQIARAVDGVVSVENKLSVDPALKDRPRSSFNQKISDAAISASVKSKLLLNRGTHGLDIGVTTTGNVVELSGAVRSELERKTAEQVALSTGGVREVKNLLKVQLSPTGSETESKDVATAVNDGWISMQVRSYLAFSSDFPGSEVHVNTTNGVVKLEGYARNAQQRELIERQVAEFVGVKAVENKIVTQLG